MSDQGWARRLAAITEQTENGERAWWRRQVFHKAGPYKPTAPKFHIYVKRYFDGGEARWVGLCGYGYSFAEALDDHPFTRLRDPGKGEQCAKCRKRAGM